jgi:carbon-monoxide dehydrogenase medium subunit
MIPGSFEYYAPRSLGDAVKFLAEHREDVKILSGGQSLLPLMKMRLSKPAFIVDIGRIPGLDAITEEGDSLVLGALVTHTQIEDSELLKKKCPLMPQTATTIADVQVRNRGTIGGSVAHADPGADFPVILTALNASFVVQSSLGSRIIAADDFFTDFFTTAMNANEILTEIRVPLPAAGTGTAYAKFPHPASGYVVVSAGALIVRQSSGSCASARLALGGLGSGPIRAAATETALTGNPLTPEIISAAAAKAGEGTDPVEDSYAGAEYKRHVATVYARKAIEAAVARAAN